TIAADQAIELKENAPGWTRSTAEQPADAENDTRPTRFTMIRVQPDAEALRVDATARPLVALPPLVIPRLWIRTVQGPDYQLRTTAWCRVDARDGTFSVSLPPGSEWTRARAGGKDLTP